MKASEIMVHLMPSTARQLLPREAYVDSEWLAREQEELFGNQWAYVGLTTEIEQPGAYQTIQVGSYPLFVLRGAEGELRAFHNLCRHRGTELMEGRGVVEQGSIVCPYHRWAYRLDGSLKAVPMKDQCFSDFEVSETSLHRAAVGEFKGLVFVHPNPAADFAGWLADLPAVAWPHEFEHMQAGPELIYEMRCNWKVFFENAIDGYHLAYLHDQTLGGPRADHNVWDVHGRHLVWYSTETEKKTCMPEAVRRAGTRTGTLIEGVESEEYGGVYMLFPNTIVTASPASFSLSTLNPITPDVSELKVRIWSAKGYGDSTERLEKLPGYDPESGMMKLERLDKHPLETGDFHWEDVWICEKMQRSLHSPRYSVGPLASGGGAESPLTFFQHNVMDYVSSSSN